MPVQSFEKKKIPVFLVLILSKKGMINSSKRKKAVRNVKDKRFIICKMSWLMSCDWKWEGVGQESKIIPEVLIYDGVLPVIENGNTVSSKYLEVWN